MHSTEVTVLDVRNLSTEYPSVAGPALAVDDVSFSVRAGEILAIVGESGSGKSATALSVMALMPRTAGRVVAGKVLLEERDLLRLSESDLRDIRGNEVAMIFQNPMTALNPVLSVGRQLTEVLREHKGLSKAAARERAVELLRMVEIPDPESRLDTYPHQLSGGLRQRVMIALALSCEPRLLIADEATTALDVTTQAQILKLLKRLTARFGTAMVVITHNMGVVASLADRVAVMYAGRIVELSSVRDIFNDPQHPYTVGLLGSIPRMDSPRSEELVAIEGRPPSLSDRLSGCPFAPRCPLVMEKCVIEDPTLESAEPGSSHLAACWAEVSEVRALASKRPGSSQAGKGRGGR